MVLFAEKSGKYGPILRFRSRLISAAQAPRAEVVHRHRQPRLRCRTNRRGDLLCVVALPPDRRHRPLAVVRALPNRGGGAATQPGNDATPQGTHKGCPYGHRGLEVSKELPHRPRSGEILREKGGLGTEAFQSAVPIRRRRGGQECPPSEGAPAVIGDWKFQ